MFSVSLVLVMTMAGSSPAADPAPDGFKVVAHPTLDVSSVSRAELSKIFLGRLRTWSDGRRTQPVDQLPDRPVRQHFSRRVHRLGVVTVELWWKRQTYSGRNVPPPEVGSDREVLEFVRTHPGGVGYIGPATEASGVRRLEIRE